MTNTEITFSSPLALEAALERVGETQQQAA